MGRRTRKSFVADAFALIFTYLDQTTVHGFRYLATSRYLWERLFWVISIAGSTLATTYMLVTSFNESYEFPVLTTVDTTSVNDLPFPAVTIDAGEALNPWGFAEMGLNFLAFECYPDPGECKNATELRQGFDFLLHAASATFGQAIAQKLDAKNLTQLEKFRRKLGMAKDSSFPQFREAAAMLAHMDKKSAFATYDKMSQMAGETIAKYTTTGKFFPLSKDLGQIFYAIIRDAAEKVEMDMEKVASCAGNFSVCPVWFKSSYIELLQPFVMNRAPYLGMGFGEFTSYFTRQAISSKPNSKIFFLNKHSGNSDLREKIIENYLANVTNRLNDVAEGEKDKIDISTYELTKLLDKHHSTPQAPFIETKEQCNFGLYTELWRSYIYKMTFRRVNERFGYYDSIPTEVPCENKTLIDWFEIKGCCLLKDRYKRHLETAERIMKYAIQVPHFELSDADKRDFSKAEQFLGYKTQPWAKAKDDLNPRIFMCQYNRQPGYFNPRSCNLFVRSYTNEGFGYTFNGGPFWSKHRSDNAFNRLFYSLMNPTNTSLGDEVVYPMTSGSAYGLTVVMQLNKYSSVLEDVHSTRKVIPTPVFKVSIHDPSVPADMRGDGVKIEPGYVSTFLITPSQLLTDEKVRQQLSPERRKCWFQAENDNMRVFSKYTQKGCIFECQLRQAAKRCGCTPWNYPRESMEMDDDGAELCDYMGAECFNVAMADTKTVETCDCYHDCDSFRYTYSVSSTILDIDKLCGDKATLRVFGGTNTSLPNMFIRSFQKYAFGKEVNTVDACKENAKRSAFVTFQLAGQVVTQIKRDIRVTFADVVSNFGGTVGLFTGTSILSLCEIIFWLTRLFLGADLSADEEGSTPCQGTKSAKAGTPGKKKSSTAWVN